MSAIKYRYIDLGDGMAALETDYSRLGPLPHHEMLRVIGAAGIGRDVAWPVQVSDGGIIPLSVRPRAWKRFWRWLLL